MIEKVIGMYNHYVNYYNYYNHYAYYQAVVYAWLVRAKHDI